MRIKNQDEILKIEIRKKIIEEIKGPENKARKEESFKRQMLYKDKTEYYVLDLLERQLDRETVREMSFAISTLSIYRKVVDKLAKVYAYGCNRFITDERGEKIVSATDNLNKLEKELDVNSKQKIINRYLKAHRNTVMYVKPCPEETGLYDISLLPLPPYLYDVVEDYYDRTEPMVYILSNYKPSQVRYSSQDSSKEGRSFDSTLKTPFGNQKDELIADKPEDADAESTEYIWWSDKYHFTTNDKGEIVSETIDNPHPKKIKPFVNYALDQDGQFWAEGGEDLADGAIRINAQISHQNYIGQLQGYGQFYFIGKQAPKNMRFGPNQGIVLEYEKDDPVPSIGFASASPQLPALQAQTEMQLAMLLTTNNLSTSGVSTSMGQAQTFPSGVSLMLDKAESQEDVRDQQQLFMDKEPDMWEIINGWLQLYEAEGLLEEDLIGLQYPDVYEVNLTFPAAPIIQSEKERLDAIQLRKDLGLNTEAELIQIDRPNLTDKEAEMVVEEIKKQKMDNMAEMQSMATQSMDQGAMNAGQENNGQQKQDNFGAGPVQ